MAATEVDAPSVPGLWDRLPEGAARELAQAGLDAFAERGFAATTTRDVAQRAGLSPAGLYVHYPSKAALLGTLSRAGHAAAAEQFERSLADAPGVDPVARIAHAVGDFAGWHARHHTVARVIQLELGALGPEDREVVVGLRRRIQGRLADEVRVAVEAGAAAVPDVGGTARALMSLAIDVCRWWDPAGRESPDDLAALYTELAARTLRPG